MQRGEGPAGHADVESTALSPCQDLGGEGVIGGAEARTERRGGESHRRAHSGRGAGVGERRGGQSRPTTGDGELTGQARLGLLGDGVVDGGGAEQQGAAHRDGEDQRRRGR